MDILVNDEFVKDPSDSGAVELRHVDSAWARLAPAAAGVRHTRRDQGPVRRIGTGARVDRCFGRDGGHAQDGDAGRSRAGRSGDVGRRGGEPRRDRDHRALQRHGVEQGPELLSEGSRQDGQEVRLLRLHERRPDVRVVEVGAAGSQARPDRVAADPDRAGRAGPGDGVRGFAADAQRHQDATRGSWRSTTRVSTGSTSGRRRHVPRRSATGTYSAASCPAKDQVCGTSPLPAELSVYPVKGPVDGKAVHLPKSKSAGSAKVNPLLQQAMDTIAGSALR